MPTDDDVFIAHGRPEGVGAGFICDGNMNDGAELEGKFLGARCISAIPNQNQIQPTGRLGVWAIGDDFGVYGQTDNRGPNLGFGFVQRAGVFGTSDVRPGVAGTSSLDAGVVGQSGDVSVATGTAGVVGSSQSFPGVNGVSSTGNGVVGRSDTGFGVVGHSSKSMAVVGISGEEFGIVGGPATGVLGICIRPASQNFSDAPAGVIGTSATNPGVIGTSATNTGVIGTSATNPGVIGTSTQSSGVVGQSGPAAPVSFTGEVGVFGTSTDSTGVAGISTNLGGVFAQSINSFGVIAVGGQAGPIFGLPFTSPAAMLATSFKGPGVVGTSGESDGVLGFSEDSVGVFGNSGSLGPVVPNTSNIAGVVGTSDRQHGVLGTSKASVGVVGFSNNIGVLGFVTAPGTVAGQFIGDLQVTGTKAAVVPFPDGTHRALYCMESPELWFEDFGSARLNRGRATVKLDGDFAKVVTLNGYRVFLTPEGDCKGLYVRSKRGGSFEVGELQGGTCNVAFSYRIVAKRKDVKRHTRFAKIDTPVLAPVGKVRVARRKAARLPAATRALFAALEKETRKKAT